MISSLRRLFVFDLSEVSSVLEREVFLSRSRWWHALANVINEATTAIPPITR